MPKPKKKANNPFVENVQHYGPITVRQLMEVVSDTAEFPKGLDTRICIGDVEGNLGVIGECTITAHAKSDIVLSVDPNSGDMDYDSDK